MGKNVHYMDVPGLVCRFATLRLRKRGLPITIIEAQPDRIHIPGQYDIIYADAVLEHPPAPLQPETTGAIGAAVDSNGLLIFLVDLGGPTEEGPMHHEGDIIALHGLLGNAGLSCEAGLNSFYSIWHRR